MAPENEMIGGLYKLGVPEDLNDEVSSRLRELGLTGPVYLEALNAFKYSWLFVAKDVHSAVDKLIFQTESLRHELERILGRRYDEDDPYCYQAFDFLGLPEQIEGVGAVESDSDAENDTYAIVARYDSIADSEKSLIRHRIRQRSLGRLHLEAVKRLERIREMNQLLTKGIFTRNFE
ncbi:MAG: hypothetical protein OEY44_00830 [Candidatus Peregrinibacteria bacterium]|nr:hypothetical protein [Candidatus Peregrinibacteria bacterium]